MATTTGNIVGSFFTTKYCGILIPKLGMKAWISNRPSEDRGLLCIKASSSSSSSSSSGMQKIEKINGKRVNGSIEAAAAPPYIKKKNNSNSSSRTSERVKENSGEVPVHDFQLGRFVEGRFVYRQLFVIRSYEIGPDKTATMETLMNLLQETALNHVMSSGLAGDGFGATQEMNLRKLIWVVTRVHIQVEEYSSWGDVVEVDTWVDAAGKNGMRREWVIRDNNTQKIITRATSTWVTMNRDTRRLSKMPEQVREEVKPFYLDRAAIAEEAIDNNKIDKLSNETAESIRSGLAPRWSDMDANQHVNNVKYIGWIMESVPLNVLEHYNLSSLTLEYRRECRLSHLLESLTHMEVSVAKDSNPANTSKTDLRSTHLIRMEEDKAEIVRARAEWRSKGKRK